MIIRSRAPLRIGFFGGGTDVPPYSYEHGGKVFTAAINKYAYTSWQISDNKDLTVHSHDLNINTKVEDLVYDGKYDLIKATFKCLNLNRGGHFTLHSDAPVGSGLGTSSAVNVSLVGAIWDGIGKTAEKPFTLAKTRKEIADTAFRIEREELGIAGGYQDQYVAAFGGFNIIEMDKNKNIHVIPLRIPKDILSELQYSILLCDIKSTRNSGTIIEDQKKEYSTGKNLEVHHKLKELVTPGVNALLNSDIKHFGELLHESWLVKKEISKGTSNTYIDAIYSAARESGAVYGGKISGAGGGGHMVLICDPTRKLEVQKAIIKKALEFSAGTDNISNLVDFKTISFDDKGLYVWRV